MSSFDYKDEQLGAAQTIALKERAVRACDRHEDVLINNGDPAARTRALKSGAEFWDRSEVGGPRDAFLTTIEWVIDDAHGKCPRCP